MTALTEEERVLRLGVPPTPGLPVSELETDDDGGNRPTHGWSSIAAR